MGAALLESPHYSNVQETELISDAEQLLHLGLTLVGSTSLTFLEVPTGTLGDLLRSGLCGIWKDRPEVVDTLRFSRELRAAAERRTGDSQRGSSG